MKTEKEIKELIKLLESPEGYKTWDIISFTPSSYTDVVKTLEWVLEDEKSGYRKAESGLKKLKKLKALLKQK